MKFLNFAMLAACMSALCSCGISAEHAEDLKPLVYEYAETDDKEWFIEPRLKTFNEIVFIDGTDKAGELEAFKLLVNRISDDYYKKDKTSIKDVITSYINTRDLDTKSFIRDSSKKLGKDKAQYFTNLFLWNIDTVVDNLYNFWKPYRKELESAAETRVKILEQTIALDDIAEYYTGWYIIYSVERYDGRTRYVLANLREYDKTDDYKYNFVRTSYDITNIYDCFN